MIRLKVRNKAQVIKTLDDWEALVKLKIEALAKGLATEALYSILYRSAQYSGDFAANWKLSYGSPDTTFQDMVLGKSWGDPDPYIMGDQPAISHAINAARGKLDGFTLGQTIYISNSAEHTHSYAWMIEGNKIKFRSGNKGEPIRVTADEMKVRYAWVSRGSADRLIAAAL